MPHGYCTECRARVTAVDGRCLLGHHVDRSTISSRRGRRIAGSAALAQESAVSVLERVLPRDVSPVSSPVTPPLGTTSAPTRPAPVKPQRQPGDKILDSSEHRRVVVSTNSPRVDATTPTRAASAGMDLNPTGEMVLQLWDSKSDPDDNVFDDWQVADALSGMPERGGPRIASAALLILGLVAVIVSVSLIFSTRGSDREALVASSQTLATSLSDFDATSQSDFAGLDRAARDVLDAAQKLDVGDPGRALAIDAATRVLDGERALSEALGYQTRFTVFMGRPALPTATDNVGDVSATYTAWSTDLLQAIEPVPNQAAFDAHQTTVADFTDKAQGIQVRYLDALRAGDAKAATNALTAIDNLVNELETSVSTAIATARGELSATVAAAQTLLQRIPAAD